jgi:hypothetical protein
MLTNVSLATLLASHAMELKRINACHAYPAISMSKNSVFHSVLLRRCGSFRHSSSVLPNVLQIIIILEMSTYARSLYRLLTSTNSSRFTTKQAVHLGL